MKKALTLGAKLRWSCCPLYTCFNPTAPSGRTVSCHFLKTNPSCPQIPSFKLFIPCSHWHKGCQEVHLQRTSWHPLELAHTTRASTIPRLLEALDKCLVLGPSFARDHDNNNLKINTVGPPFCPGCPCLCPAQGCAPKEHVKPCEQQVPWTVSSANALDCQREGKWAAGARKEGGGHRMAVAATLCYPAPVRGPPSPAPPHQVVLLWQAVP